jgi:excisionase family DNA binding protein
MSDTRLAWRRDQAAAALSVSTQTVDAWIKQGLLDATRVGGIVLISDDSIHMLLRGDQ